MKETRFDPRFEPNFKLVTADNEDVDVNVDSLAFHSQIFRDMVDVSDTQASGSGNKSCKISETKAELDTLFTALVDWKCVETGTLAQFLTLAVLHDKYQFYVLEQLLTAKCFKNMEFATIHDISKAFKIFYQLGNEPLWRFCAEKLVQSSQILILKIDELDLPRNLLNLVLAYYAQRAAALSDTTLHENITCSRVPASTSYYRTNGCGYCGQDGSYGGHSHDFSNTTITIRSFQTSQEDMVRVLADKLKKTGCHSCATLLQNRMQQIQTKLDKIPL